MSTAPFPITVLIRFAYPGLSGWRGAGEAETVEDRMARLYAPARLEARLDLLERLAIPSLAAQTDRRFVTGVLVGRTLPGWARDRLKAALAPLDDARIVARPPMHHARATSDALEQLLGDREGRRHMTMRLDDDDAMDAGTIERHRRIASRWEASRTLVIGTQRGYFLTLGGEGGPVIREVVERLPIGIGLSMTAPRGAPDTVFARDHRKLPEYFDTITEATTPGYVRTVHAGNDSDAEVTGRVLDTPQAQIVATLRERFGLDPAALGLAPAA
ncbi:MAG: glycosyltransferase [Paracoccaceae bacterium]